MDKSIKSDNLLKRFGVLESLKRGDPQVFAGPVYELRKEPEAFIRMVFHRDDEGRLCVGYARHNSDTKEWEVVESEPYTMRSYGYYDRRIKRIGDYVGNAIPVR